MSNRPGLSCSSTMRIVKIADLKGPEETWADAYRRCKADHPAGHWKHTLSTGYRQGNPDHVSDSEFSEEVEDDEREMDDFHLMCQEGGRTRGIGGGTQRLGVRDID